MRSRTQTEEKKKQNFDEITDDNARKPWQPSRFFTQPKEKMPPKTCAAAVLLLTIGVVMLLLGLWSFLEGTDRERTTAFFAIGGITFVPGSYASYILFGAWMRWRGFKYHQVPSYDE